MAILRCHYSCSLCICIYLGHRFCCFNSIHSIFSNKLSFYNCSQLLLDIHLSQELSYLSSYFTFASSLVILALGESYLLYFNNLRRGRQLDRMLSCFSDNHNNPMRSYSFSSCILFFYQQRQNGLISLVRSRNRIASILE